MYSNKNKIFSAKTVYTSQFKTIIEVLQNIIPETTIIVNGKNPDDENAFYGLEISTNDVVKSMFIRLKMFGQEFSSFNSKFLRYNIDLDLSELNNNVFKTINSASTSIELFLNENDKQNLNISINDDKISKISNYKHKLMDLNYTYRKPVMTEYDVVIIMSNAEFHKTCKEKINMTNFVDIKCSEKNIIFSSAGDMTNCETIYKTNEGGISIEWKNDISPKIVQAVFDLRNIVLFNKCNTLCPNIMILMKNDYILSIVYEIGTFSQLNISFSPVKQEYINNKSYNYSDDENNIEDDIKLINTINEDLSSNDNEIKHKIKKEKKVKQKEENNDEQYIIKDKKSKKIKKIN